MCMGNMKGEREAKLASVLKHGDEEIHVEKVKGGSYKCTFSQSLGLD